MVSSREWHHLRESLQRRRATAGYEGRDGPILSGDVAKEGSAVIGARTATGNKGTDSQMSPMHVAVIGFAVALGVLMS